MKNSQSREKIKVPQAIRILYERANSHERREFAEKARKNRDYYNNEQVSESEMKTLRASGMPDFTVNRITPVIEMISYFVTENTPRWQAVGRDGSDSAIAQIHSSVAEYTWDISNGQSVYGQVIQEALVEGVGFFHVDFDPNMDKGNGEVVIKRVSPYDVYIDVASTDILCRDAAYMIIKKDLPRGHLMQLLPDFRVQIAKAQGVNERGRGYSNRAMTNGSFKASDIFYTEDITTAYDTEGYEDDILDYYERYSKEPVEFVNVTVKIPPTQEEINDIKQSVMVAVKETEIEMQVQVKEREFEINKMIEDEKMIPERRDLEIAKMKKGMQIELRDMQQRLLSDAIQDATQIKVRQVTKKEFEILAEQEEFMKNVVDARAFFENRIRVSVSIGSDTLLYEKQLPIREYPIIPIFYIHNGTPLPLSAVSMLRGKQEEINKAHQILIHNASLGSSLRFSFEQGAIDVGYWEKYSSAPGALLPYNPGFSPPTPMQPMQLNSAFYGIVHAGEQEMEYLSGVYSSMQGNVSAQHDTFKGLLANDEYGTRRIRAWQNKIIKPALKHLGEVHMDYCQNVYTQHKVFRLVQPDRTTVQEINVPLFNDVGEEVGRYNDYQSAKMDVILVGGATMPVNRWALRQEYLKWYELGLIDDIAFLAETDVKNKDEIIKRKSKLAQISGQVQQLEDVIKDRDGAIETLKRQIIQSEIRNEILKANMEVQKAKVEQKAEIEAVETVETAKQKMATAQAGKGGSKKNFKK